MADNVTVSNSPVSSNADIPVRSIDKGGEQIQVVAVDYGGAGAEDLTVPDFATETTLASIDGKVATEATLASINSQIIGGITATLNSDVLGAAVTAVRNNEVELSFFDSFNSDIITNTTASGGSATISGGHARYRTGTNATGAAKGVSVYSCKYRPAHEQYCFFTAAFTAGVANSFQRIGLYDTNNGFFIGYEGTSFGVTLRTGASDTTTARASWNGDALDGSAGSLFTRGGNPEAINLTYSNLYRIRFAWLGSASVYFEVFSPDGNWVTFHTIKIPNSQLDPSIQNPELPITIHVAKTSGASDLSLYSACVASGTTSADFPINETLNEYSLAKLTRSVITGQTSAGGGGFVNVKVAPSGSLITALGDIDGVSGQETMANSLPVVIASDQSAVPISDDGGSITVDGTVAATQSGTWNINSISGTVSLPTGAATESTLSTLDGKVTACNTGSVTLASQANPFTSAIPVEPETVSTSSVTSTTASASSVTVLASNASRKLAVFVNDSDKIAYVKLGGTASITSYSYKLQPNSTLELAQPVYTGVVDAIWETSPTGAMRVTELT
jgi:hypothetical protein